MAVVPNSKLSQAIVTNFSLPTPEVVVAVDVTVDYASDTQLVEDLARRGAREVAVPVDGAVPTADPVFRFGAFGDGAAAPGRCACARRLRGRSLSLPPRAAR